MLGLPAWRRPVESTMSTNRIVARTQSTSSGWRTPVRNSAITSTNAECIRPTEDAEVERWTISAPGMCRPHAVARFAGMARGC